MKKFAVITGDLVSSRSIEAGIRENLYAAIDAFAKSAEKNGILHYDRFRGDSLQFTADRVTTALRAALLMRCFILSHLPKTKTKKKTTKGYTNTQFDIRLAIGIGNIDFINQKNLSGSDGEAFVLSGQALDAMKTGGERMAIVTTDENTNAEWETIITLLDAIMQKWTQNGAELVLQKLLQKKDEEIAQLFNISLPAVTQRKKNAQWYAINKTIQYFEHKFPA